MVMHGWLVSGMIIIITSLVSSELQEVYHQNIEAAIPPSICSGDLSFTKGYRCRDYDVSNLLINYISDKIFLICLYSRTSVE